MPWALEEQSEPIETCHNLDMFGLTVSRGGALCFAVDADVCRECVRRRRHDENPCDRKQTQSASEGFQSHALRRYERNFRAKALSGGGDVRALN